MKRKLPVLASLLMLVAGCAGDPPTPIATHLPSPSATSVIGIASETPPMQAVSTTTPIAVIGDPSPESTSVAEPEEVLLPSEKVSIIAPGPGSSITSPVRVRGQAGPAWLDRVQISLIGESGQVITESIAFLYNLPGNLGPYNFLLEFPTSLVAEAARLEVRNFSRYDGKLDHLASVDVTLLSIGSERIYYALHGPEKLVINAPRQFETLSSGEITVVGAGWVDSDTPLKLEILGFDDEIIGSTEVRLNPDEIGVAGTFEVSLTYSVDAPQRGRIALYEPSSTIPGMIHYTSIIVQLNP
jgi:hypothetical protein